MKKKSDIIFKCEERFKSLPKVLTQENINEFVSSCKDVDNMLKDPSLYRVLLPFHGMTWTWENAYGEGFTWEEFLKVILKDGSTNVTYKKGSANPCLSFSDSERENFLIAVVFCD